MTYFLGREGEQEDGGERGEGGGEKSVVVQEKGFLQRLKEVFWKEEEDEERERERNRRDRG